MEKIRIFEVNSIIFYRYEGKKQMIKYVKGDIFDSPSKIIVDTVNTVGVMGKGIALEYKKRYPEMFVKYNDLCKKKLLDIGNLYLWKESDKWILLFPTKAHWRNPSKLEYIEKGLMKFADNWDKLGADSIAFPRLGCGNGGLDWIEVKPLMEKYLNRIPMQILVYIDNYNDPIPEHLNNTELEKWLSGEMGLFGFEAFKVKLKRFLNSDNYVIKIDGVDHSINDQCGMLCIDNTLLSESDVCEMWNWVRDTGVFMHEEMPDEYENVSRVFLEVLKKLEYISSIFISKDGINFSAVPNGFQYIAD